MEGVKLTLCVLSWLKLQKKWQSFNPFSDNEELQHNELDPDVNYYLDEIYFSLSFFLSFSFSLSLSWSIELLEPQWSVHYFFNIIDSLYNECFPAYKIRQVKM